MSLTVRSRRRLEDALWLIEMGEHPTRAARRAGTTVQSLYNLCRRAGIPTPPALLVELSHIRRQQVAARETAA